MDSKTCPVSVSDPLYPAVKRPSDTEAREVISHAVLAFVAFLGTKTLTENWSTESRKSKTTDTIGHGRHG